MPGQARSRSVDAFPVACPLPRAAGDGQPVRGTYLVRSKVADALPVGAGLGVEVNVDALERLALAV